MRAFSYIYRFLEISEARAVINDCAPQKKLHFVNRLLRMFLHVCFSYGMCIGANQNFEFSQHFRQNIRGVIERMMHHERLSESRRSLFKNRNDGCSEEL